MGVLRIAPDMDTRLFYGIMGWCALSVGATIFVARRRARQYRQEIEEIGRLMG
jgi:hypothetical protein